MRAAGPEVHPALVQLRIAGFQRPSPLLPERPAEHVHLVGQQGELMKGSDEAPEVDLGLGHPAEVAEFPELHVRPREMRQEDAVQVGWFGKPLPEIPLHPAALAIGLLRRVGLCF